MKLAVALLLSVFALVANADVTSTPVAPGKWTLMRGSSNIKTGLDSLQACNDAGKADAEARKATANYKCRSDVPFTVTYSKPVCPAKPENRTQMNQCPAGFVGSWTQVQTPVANAYPTCWTFTAWTPTEAPAGACTAIVVKPPAATEGYTKCASENATCTITASNAVIYGSGEKFTTPKVLAASFVCNNATFGGDPAFGIVKECWIKPASGTTDPTPPDMSFTGPVIDYSAIPPDGVGSAGFDVRDTIEVAPASDSGAFRTHCGFAKMARIDPIVTFGTVGQSHLHTFFGNVNVNQNSTTESLLASGNSTCRGGIANRSSYWIPTMIDTATNKPIVPSGNGVYYKSGFTSGDKLTDPIPFGLRMVAGNPRRSTPRLDSDEFSFRYKCIGGPNNQNALYGSEIANCDVGAELWTEIFFPQCWDGKNLDSPDHKSHMSYPVLERIPDHPQGWSRQVCPASHPRIIPQITFNVIYKQTVKDGSLKWRLSSDMYDPAKPGGYSAHADWFNAWDQSVSDAWFNNCLKNNKDCHSHLLGDGRMIF